MVVPLSQVIGAAVAPTLAAAVGAGAAHAQTTRDRARADQLRNDLLDLAAEAFPITAFIEAFETFGVSLPSDGRDGASQARAGYLYPRLASRLGGLGLGELEALVNDAKVARGTPLCGLRPQVQPAAAALCVLSQRQLEPELLRLLTYSNVFNRFFDGLTAVAGAEYASRVETVRDAMLRLRPDDAALVVALATLNRRWPAAKLVSRLEVLASGKVVPFRKRDREAQRSPEPETSSDGAQGGSGGGGGGRFTCLAIALLKPSQLEEMMSRYLRKKYEGSEPNQDLVDHVQEEIIHTFKSERAKLLNISGVRLWKPDEAVVEALLRLGGTGPLDRWSAKTYEEPFRIYLQTHCFFRSSGEPSAVDSSFPMVNTNIDWTELFEESVRAARSHRRR